MFLFVFLPALKLEFFLYSENSSKLQELFSKYQPKLKKTTPEDLIETPKNNYILKKKHMDLGPLCNSSPERDQHDSCRLISSPFFNYSFFH